MFKANEVMLPSMVGDTVSVRVVWVIPLGTRTVFSLFQYRVSHWFTFAGVQSPVVIVNAALALPMFLIQTVLVVLPPGVSAPQSRDDASWVHRLSE